MSSVLRQADRDIAEPTAHHPGGLSAIGGLTRATVVDMDGHGVRVRAEPSGMFCFMPFSHLKLTNQRFDHPQQLLQRNQQLVVLLMEDRQPGRFVASLREAAHALRSGKLKDADRALADQLRDQLQRQRSLERRLAGSSAPAERHRRPASVTSMAEAFRGIDVGALIAEIDDGAEAVAAEAAIGVAAGPPALVAPALGRAPAVVPESAPVAAEPSAVTSAATLADAPVVEPAAGFGAETVLATLVSVDDSPQAALELIDGRAEVEPVFVVDLDAMLAARSREATVAAIAAWVEELFALQERAAVDRFRAAHGREPDWPWEAKIAPANVIVVADSHVPAALRSVVVEAGANFLTRPRAADSGWLPAHELRRAIERAIS